ncbi:MAG: cation:proton antiporter, partial [Lentisphaeria bacterium]|nr:cation:proton antiporter [Lentisphaeria bacterium]
MLEELSTILTRYWNGLSTTEMLVAALIIIVIAGMIGGMIAKKLHQPLLLGYILAGVFVGIAYKASFGDNANAALDSLANIGVALLLFSMGMEFEKRDLIPIRKIAIWGTLSQVAFTFAAGAGIAWILNSLTGWFEQFVTMFLFATAFVSTSTAVVLKTLGSRGQMGTLSSKVMIGMSIVQDLTVIPMFMILSKLGNLSDGIWAAVSPLLFGAVFMALMMTVGAKYLPYVLRWVAKTNTKELFLLAVTGIALGAGFIADMMQVSFSFGAFLAGIALSDSAYGKKAISELMPVR